MNPEIVQNNNKFSVSSMTLKFYIFCVFRTALFHVPILVIYLQTMLQDPFQIGILLSLKTVSTLIFEIPTGYVADKVSRKLSILIGVLLNIVGLLIFIFTREFILLAIAQIVFGLSETFSSGADSALLYDNLEILDASEKFESIQKNISLFGSLVLFTSFIMGSYIYNYKQAFPFVLTTISLAFSFAVFTTLKEYQYKENKRGIDDNNKQKGNSVIQSILKEPKCLWHYLIFTNLIGAIFYSAYLFILPILLKSTGISEKYFGIIFSAGVLLFGIGAKISGIISIKHKFLTIIGPISSASIFFLGGVIKAQVIAIILLALMRLIWGAYVVISNVFINQQIKNSNVRASILSVGSGIEGGFSTLLILLYGFLTKYIELQQMIIIISIMFLVVGILFYITRSKRTVDTLTNRS